MFESRSQYLAGFTACAAFNFLNSFVEPRLVLGNLDFSRHWLWCGPVRKPAVVRTMKIRKNVWRGDYYDMRDEARSERPACHINGLGTVDPRRAMFELFHPEEGMQRYQLVRNGLCQEANCINPEHFSAKPVKANDRGALASDFLPQGHPLYAHNVGSWHLGSAEVVSMPSGLPNEILASAIDAPALHAPWAPPIGPLFGHNYGWRSDDPARFYETDSVEDKGLGLELQMKNYDCVSVWQAKTGVYASQCGPAILWWLKKWGPKIPDYYFINGWDSGEMDEIWKEMAVTEVINLSDLLARYKFWIHPKVILDWYKGLDDDRKRLINLFTPIRLTPNNAMD